jgi:hypothetical protein
MASIEIPIYGCCDYCDRVMKYAGADPILRIVRRACEIHYGMANIQLKVDEWATNKTTQEIKNEVRDDSN